MVFMGVFTDLKTAKPLYDYLGASPSVITDASEEAMVNFTQEYADHSTFTFDRDWFKLMNSAPPLFRNRSDWQVKGDSKVFGKSVIKNIQLDYPIYVLQQHLNRKNMVFIGENIWRMRSHTYIEAGDFDAFDIWLYNNIQWLMVQEDKRRFKVKPSKPLFTGNEMILFKGQAYDESYKPIEGAEIKLTVKGPEGKENIYYMSESGEARYYLEVSNLEEGTYQYEAEGKQGETLIGTDRGQFSIGKSNVEHFRLKADRDLMEQIALRTGGEFIYAQDLASLPAKIQALETLKPVTDMKKSRMGLHEIGWILALLWLF